MIKLVDQNKKIYRFTGKFSYWYFFFGPFYTLVKKKFSYSILAFIYHFIIFPKYWVESILHSLKFQENIIKILAYPHASLDIFTTLLILIVPHIIISFFIDRYFLRQAIEKDNYFAASDEDLEKLKKISKKYENIPVDPSYLEKLSFIESSNRYIKTSQNQNKSVLDLDEDNLKTKEEKLQQSYEDEILQNQLNILYGKYKIGLISEEELIKEKENLLSRK